MGYQRARSAAKKVTFQVWLLVLTFVGGYFSRTCEEADVEFVYPDSKLWDVQLLAETLEQERWKCEGEGCVEDFMQVSVLLHIYAEKLNIDVQLLRGLLMVENPWFKVDAVSSAGAVGLMQVMPFHVFAECEALGGLASVEGNLCAGTRVLERYLHRGLEYALLRYNGCVWEDAPCTSYPDRVMEYTE